MDVGVGERLGPLGPERCMERLRTKGKKTKQRYVSVKPSFPRLGDDDRYIVRCAPYGVEKRHDLRPDCLRDWTQYKGYRTLGVVDRTLGGVDNVDRSGTLLGWRLLYHVFMGSHLARMCLSQRKPRVSDLHKESITLLNPDDLSAVAVIFAARVYNSDLVTGFAAPVSEAQRNGR